LSNVGGCEKTRLSFFAPPVFIGVLRFVFEGVDKKQTDTAYQNMLIVCFFYFKLYYTIGKICWQFSGGGW